MSCDGLTTGIVVDDLVLDVTVFQDIHPGGESMFVMFAGKQCGWQVSGRGQLIQFRRFHRPEEILKLWRCLVIGRVAAVMENEYPEV